MANELVAAAPLLKTWKPLSAARLGAVIPRVCTSTAEGVETVGGCLGIT
jgi:hypothetical protein